MKLTKKQVASMKRLHDDVDKNWPLRKGKNEFLKWLSGGNVTRLESMSAQCYHCSGGYDEGAYDCETAICPLYNYHPYRTAASRKEMNQVEKDALLVRLKRGRENARIHKQAQPTA